MISLIAQVDVDDGIVFGLEWFLNQDHTRLLRSSTSFFHVAGGTGTDDICPDGLAACASRDDVVE